MRQFGTILKFELKYYFKNKAFVGITVFLIVAIAAVMFFPRIAAAVQTDSGSTGTQEKTVMLVAAKDDATAASVQAAFAAAFADYDVQTAAADTQALKSAVTSGDAECAFYIESPMQYTYYVNNLSMYDAKTATADSVLQNLYRLQAMQTGGLSADAAQQILTAEITHTTESLGKDQTQNFFYTYIMIFALYMLIMMYGQMVATNVATEKSSRAMELLITSAKPTSMMFGKVIASCMAGLFQLAAVFGCAFVCYNANKAYWGGDSIAQSLFAIPGDLLAYMLIFFVLGFFIYAFLYGAIGSTASKLEDINTSVMPLTLLFVAAFVVVITAMFGDSVDSTLMKVCSFVPFTSPIAMFTRIAMSTVPVYEIWISIAILVASVIGIGVLSAKIYRVGVLLYGTPPKISAIIKAVKNSK